MISHQGISVSKAVFARLSQVLLSVGVSFLLISCAPTRPPIETSSWQVLPVRTGAVRKPHSNVWLKVGAFNVSPPYDGRSLVYRLGDQRYETDFYNGYVSLPSEMIGNATRQWINQSGIFSMTVGEGNTLFPYYTLQASVDEFYGDYRIRPEAVVSIEFFLTTTTTAKKDPIISKNRYTKRVVLKDNTPHALVAGQQQAFEEILNQFEGDLYQTTTTLPKPLGR